MGTRWVVGYVAFEAGSGVGVDGKMVWLMGRMGWLSSGCEAGG